jgi:plasmid stability protein
MPSLVIKKIPRSLHTRLRQQALRHRRSMTQETLYVLEQGLGLSPTEFPPPVKGRVPLTQKLLDQAVREGRS